MTTLADQYNNPGDLKPPNGAIIWPGQTGVGTGGFAIFDTPDAGINAADANLQTYASRGWNTPYAIAHNWSTTDQVAYTNNLATALGVGPNTPLNLSDPGVRSQVLNAIFTQEGGTIRTSDNPLSGSWSDILAAAQNGGPLKAFLSLPGIIFSHLAAPVNKATGNVVGGAISGIKSLDPGQAISDWANSAAKTYLLPIALGAGALLFILLSAWSMFKDTSAGKVTVSMVKTGAKAAMV